MLRPIATLLLVSGLMPYAQADFLLGSVRTTAGVPVANANIDVFDSSSGNELTLTADFTAADGTFAIQVPAGTYDVVALPPAPPTTTLVGNRIDFVTVSGTANVGTIFVSNGVALSGRVLLPNGAAANGVDLIGRNLATGLDVVLSTNKTNPDGTFVTSAPAGPFRLSLDPGLAQPLAAPVRITNTLNGTTNLGDIMLAPGFFITLDVRRTNGTAIAGADVDVVDRATGQELYTTDDDSDASGRADFIVPAGNFDLEVCAPTAARLAPAIVSNVTVTGPTYAGIATLANGFFLSGVVRDTQGALAVGIDLDLFVAGTTTKVLTCADDSGPTGQYLTTVAAGTYDALFEDVTSPCPESILIEDVVVSGDRVLNATMTAPALGCRYCLPGVTNSAGSPSWLDATGSESVAQNNVTLIARNVPNTVFGFFLVSSTQGEIAQPGTSAGILCLSGSIGRYVGPGQIVMSGNNGTLTLPIHLTQIPDPVLGFLSAAPGETWNFQAWYRDITAQGSSNFSTGLAITFVP